MSCLSIFIKYWQVEYHEENTDISFVACGRQRVPNSFSTFVIMAPFPIGSLFLFLHPFLIDCQKVTALESEFFDRGQLSPYNVELGAKLSSPRDNHPFVHLAFCLRYVSKLWKGRVNIRIQVRCAQDLSIRWVPSLVYFSRSICWTNMGQPD